MLHAGFAGALRDLAGYAGADPGQASARIQAASAALGAQDDGWRGVSPFVVPSVLWSLYSFVRSPDDAWECLCTAIEPGGDVDTTAAMAGASWARASGGPRCRSRGSGSRTGASGASASWASWLRAHAALEALAQQAQRRQEQR